MEMPRWLLLAHQLPTRPSKARVKTWRRLQQIGAVPAKGSVYVLPNREQCREDFEWMRTEIVALGGEATVFAAEALSGGDDEIVAALQGARDTDYQVLTREAGRFAAASRAKRASVARSGQPRTVRRLRERLGEIERIDFFGAPAGPNAVRAIAALEQKAAGPERAPAGARPPLDTRGFQNRRWVTRPRPGVDRMACAWLIRRCIDPRAVFAFVEKAAATDVPFDMYAGEFSHEGPLCTFEVLVRRFAIADAAVARVGQIVHDLDMKERRYAPPEAPAVARLIEGLQELHADDHALLQHGIDMFEALGRSFAATAQATSRGVGVRRRRKGRA